MRVHGAADIHEQEELDAVLSRRGEHEVDLTGLARGLVDGRIDVEFKPLSIPRESSESS